MSSPGLQGCVAVYLVTFEPAPTKRNLWWESLSEGTRVSMKTDLGWKLPAHVGSVACPGRGRPRLPEQLGGSQMVQVSAC